ncbi:hypothetical protein GARY_75 [Vibrio phage Gary]|uniref:Uncharacterized protein n=1 Tax=Vibrio phage Gary TaxID=2801534 RepID=A0A7U0G8D0_9CAUD|nr:hypothetical protein KNV71_gp075 [Vibrio phage Gary]QQV88179.1 hypothetical protein GARY_75 [Vibrio phage Gary]
MWHIICEYDRYIGVLKAVISVGVFRILVYS